MSVPFPFDLHVMMYSDNAPGLEGALHTLFAGRRSTSRIPATNSIAM